MLRRFCSIYSFSIVVACWLVAGSDPAPAAEVRTWVSGTGTDAGDCPVTAPCRTLAYAHSRTRRNGVINILTAGDFGPLTITKAISIVADGVEGAILSAQDGAGITVRARADAVVFLRGLTIDMRGTGNHGIIFKTGKALHVLDSVVRNTVHGILFRPRTGTGWLYATDVLVTKSSDRGVYVSPISTGSANVVLDRVNVESDGVTGIEVNGTQTPGAIVGAIRDSMTAGHATGGIVVNSGGGAIDVTLDRTTAAHNTTGVSVSGANAAVRMSNSTATGNATGLAAAAGGAIISLGNNDVAGNAADGAPTSTIARK